MGEPASTNSVSGAGEAGLAFTPPASLARELAFSGVFGVAALLLPTLFHLVHLGHVFMPMYLPLVTLAFLVRARYAVGTALLVPLLSAVLTGMPPFFPPVAILMSLELGAMAWVTAWARGRFPRLPSLAILLPALLVGRLLYVAMAWGFARVMTLPARFIAGISLMAGWPGLILMAVLIPPVLLILGRRSNRI